MFFEPPHTQTERLVVLQNFRKTGEFPSDFATAVSHQNRTAAKKTVIWMTQHDSVQRPTGMLPSYPSIQSTLNINCS